MQLKVKDVIKQKRILMGITQQQLADFVNVSKASVSKWESGQSYPDITLLPLIASYFGISIDELLTYEPNVSPKQMQAIIHSLKVDVLKDSQATYKKALSLAKTYWSSYALLCQIGLFFLNHYDLFQKVVPAEELSEQINAFFDHVIENSHDIDLIALSKGSKAFIALGENKPEQVFASLGTQTPLLYNTELLIAQALMLKQDKQHAEVIFQTSVYQYLIYLISNLSNYLPILANQPKQQDETIHHLTVLIKEFQLEQLHPFIVIPAFFQCALVYSSRKETTNTLHYIEGIVRVMESVETPFTLHGDAYFDQITDWLNKQLFVNEPPRSQEMGLASIKEGLNHPLFRFLADKDNFQIVKRRLDQAIERITTTYE